MHKTCCFVLAGLLALPGLVRADDAGTAALVKSGAYLAVAGDCMACHSTTKGAPYAGGLALSVPLLGTIYSSNITPDLKTGIGSWTLNDFDRAVRHGVSQDGHHLYPAMPYVSYAKISDADVKALYTYFMHGVAPVSQANRASEIPWPLNMRWPLALWNTLFLPDGVYQNKTGQSLAWNRGAYLVQGLAHCSTCHTPRGIGMQEQALDESGSGFLSGSVLAGWQAYNITSDAHSGIGSWTPLQLTQYLRTGNVPHLAQAAGPMGEAVQHSFSQLSATDLDAIVTYIRTVPAVRDSSGDNQARQTRGLPGSAVAQERGIALSNELDPARLYLGNCATCHQASGGGTPDGYYPSLFHNSTVGAANPGNLLQVILHGVHRKVGDADIDMPAFAMTLSDEQVAALANYVTTQFGNPAAHVTPGEVAKLR